MIYHEVAISIVTILCQLTSVNFQKIFMTPRKNSIHTTKSPSFLKHLATINLLSVSVDLPILDFSNKQNHR